MASISLSSETPQSTIPERQTKPAPPFIQNNPTDKSVVPAEVLAANKEDLGFEDKDITSSEATGHLIFPKDSDSLPPFIMCNSSDDTSSEICTSGIFEVVDIVVKGSKRSRSV